MTPRRLFPAKMPSANSQSWSPRVPARSRIIANPLAGGAHSAQFTTALREVAEWLSEHEMPTELRCATSAANATELAREAVERGMDLVIAAGGDGTINDCIQALAGTSVALGVLPHGTVNVWARELGISFDLVQAREALLRGQRRRVDLGQAGTRYFLLMAGIGMDAEIVRRVEQNWLKRYGLKMVDFVATAGTLGLIHPSEPMKLRIDGKRRTIPALMVLVSNTRLYGGALSFTPEAIVDDGLLNLAVIPGRTLGQRLRVFVAALAHRNVPAPTVRYYQCRTARLEAASHVPVQVDGEIIGELPMTFRVIPQALTVLVPRDAPTDLFRQAASSD
jgi:YegS/Rv2252/BmrU family lipid kinase